MKKQGYNPVSFEKDLSDLQQSGKEDEAMRTYGLIIDRNRRTQNSNAFGQVSRAIVDASDYQQQRVSQGANSSLDAWDDFGRSFYNGAVVRLGQGIQMLGSAIPAALDSKNPDWMRSWQDANAKWYEDNKLFTSPQAEAGIFDAKGDVNWRGVSGTIGNTLGMMVATFLPLVGQVGRVGNAVAGVGALARVGTALTSTAAQSGAIGFMQMLPMYTDEARKAGYSPQQAMMAAIPLAAAQGVLEHFGMDQLVKGMGLSSIEATSAMRLIRQEAAKDVFGKLAGKPLSVEAFKDVSEELGKGFLNRLRQPETLRRIADAAKRGAIVEGGEEFLQSIADSSLKKLFDITQGTGVMGDQTKDGKGFDPTVREFVTDAAVGTLLGGLIGGTMGGVFSGVPSSFQQQTIFAKVDADIKKLVADGGSIMSGQPDQIDQAKAGLSSYKLLEKARVSGQIDDQTYASSMEKLDSMAAVSEQLAKTGVASPTARYALFDLNGRQSAFADRFTQEIEQPTQRLNELAQPDPATGQWKPKPGLPVLQLAEANGLIAQNLPAREVLGNQIKAKIDDYVTRLVNPDEREQALKKYAADIDTDVRQFDQGARPQQTQFEENELPGLTGTMETPKGQFAVRQTSDPNRPREIVQVNTTVQNARPGVVENRDPVIDRFQDFSLPSQGQPVVRFTAVDEQTQDQLLDAFDKNPDLVQPYGQWRQGLQDKFVDDPMVGLQQARDAVNTEASRLEQEPVVTDWQKGDIERKQAWIRSSYQQVAEDPTMQYGTDDYIADHHSDFLEAAGVDPGTLANLPDEYRTGLYNAIKAGDMQTAAQIIDAVVPLTETINPQDNESNPSRLLAAFEAETDRLNRRTLVEKLAEALSGREQIIAAVGDYVNSGRTEDGVTSRLARQLDELSAYSQQLADAVREISTEQSSDEDSPTAGVDESAGAEPAGSGVDAGGPGITEPPTESQPNEKPDKVKRNKGYDPLARQPQSTTESILQYFVGKGRVLTDDVKRYGDPNWMKGASGGNPLISYVGSDETKIERIDNIARMVRLNENEDEQAVIQQIMDMLATFPSLSAKQQLMAIQQEPVEQQMAQDMPERTPMEVLEPIFAAMDRAGIDNTTQEQLARTIESDLVTADGLDWLGVYNLLNDGGFTSDPQLARFIMGEYLNQVATFVTLSDQELAMAEALTPDEVAEILAGGQLSDDVFDLVMQEYALSPEQSTELNRMLGESSPNTETDGIPNEPPQGPADAPAEVGDAEIEADRVNSQSEDDADVVVVDEPIVAAVSAAQAQRIDTAVAAAVAVVDQRIDGLDKKIRSKKTKVDSLRRDLRKRTETAPIPFGSTPENYPAAGVRPEKFDGQLKSDPVTSTVSIQPDPVINSETIVQVTANGLGYVIESGPRIARMATYRATMIEPYFSSINGVGNPNDVTAIITVSPAKFNTYGGVIEKGKVFYQARQTYDEWRAKKNGSGEQADLSNGQVTGLEAQNAAKNAIAQAEAEIAALETERNNVANTRGQVADVARRNAEAQQDLFVEKPVAEPVQQPIQQPIAEPVQQPAAELTPDEIRRQELLERKRQLAADLRRSMGSTLNAGVNPETLRIGLEYFAVSIELGVIKFRDFVREFIADTGSTIGPDEFSSLKAVYNASLDSVTDEVYSQMDTPGDLRALKLDDVLATTNEDNEQPTPNNLESDSARNGPGNGVGEAGVQPATGSSTDVPGQSGAGVSPAAGGSGSDISIPNDVTPLFREPVDQRIPGTEGTDGTPNDGAGSDERQGSRLDSDERIQLGSDPAEAIDETPGRDIAPTAVDKLAAQQAADSIPATMGDRANIDATLPYLMEGQREDVLFAEKRFMKPNGYGVVFTNGTGTGKTFLALGIAKRMEKLGKKNGLIVVPSDAVMNEWTMSAPALGLKITPLTGIKDAGFGIRITTYANFGQNAELAKEDIDFVLADEAQNFMQSAQAEVTAALRALRAITFHPEAAKDRTDIQNPEMVAELDALRKQIWTNNVRTNRDISDAEYTQLRRETDIMEARERVLRKEYNDLWEANSKLINESQGEKRPRATFLSATPFAYQKNVQWANGYLFEYPNVIKTGAYNQPDGYQQFMITHFGYRMRNNKLNEPEAGVDSNLMERQFNSYLREQGVLSARMLDIDSDYERRFVLTPNAVGSKIGEGMDWLRKEDDGRYKYLSKIVSERFNYLERQRLLEAIKAKEAIPLIKQWHAIGKKVVVFFDFNVGGGFAPFDFSELNPADEVNIYDRDNKLKETVTVKKLVAEFKAKRPDLDGIQTGDLKAPLDALLEAFPLAGVVNGMPQFKKNKIQSIRNFNDDAMPDANVLLVQSAANAGWSGHDKTAKFPRVLLNLGMPTAPTKSIQQEGRVYRQGQSPHSHSMFVYMNTGTNWERWAFASTISSRASTAENLAMGQMARGLKDAFVQAFEESETYVPTVGEGRGGKARDRSLVQAISEFDRARALYYAQTKKTAYTKASEGVDYFATPEPLGLKAVQWADVRTGDDLLEPSAGHGAIARWFPDDTRRTVVEPSFDLLSRTALVTDARQINDTFENLNIQNKYDVIVMNPPFGSSGKMASDHLQKAATQHLRNGGRVVAIVPVGAFNQKFDKWFYGVDEKGKQLTPNLHLSARILLPQSTFERAATKASTQVLIIDRIDDPKQLATLGPTDKIDLSQDIKVADFFDAIKDLDVPERPTLKPVVVEVTPAQALMSGRGGQLPSPTQAAVASSPTTAPTPPAAPAVASNPNGILMPVVKGVHSKHGWDIYTVPLKGRLEMADYRAKDQLAKSKYNGFYSSWTKGGAIAGFIFKTQADADAFILEVDGPAQPQYAGTPGASVPLTSTLINSLQSFLPDASFANLNEDGTFDQDAFDRAAVQAGLSNTPEAVLNGFRLGNKVYMNPSVLNAQTAMHEMGHIWASVMRTVNPAMLDRGLALMAGTRYEKKFLSNPSYAQREGETRTDYMNRIREEALVDAIADKGIKLLSDEKRSGFRKFLTQFWNGLKSALKKLGFPIQTNGLSMADITLEQFTDAVASQMVGGQPAAISTTGVDAQRVDAQIQMPPMAGRPIVNKMASAIASFRAQIESSDSKRMLKKEPLNTVAQMIESAYSPVIDMVLQNAPGSKSANRLTKIRKIGPFKTNPGSYYDPVSQTFNSDMLDDVARLAKGQKIKYGNLTRALHRTLLGGELSADWLKSVNGADSYINAEGDYVQADVQQETADLDNSLSAIANHKGAWGYLTKLLNSKAAGAITLPETIAHWLSANPASGLREILINTRRAWVSRASELAISRQQQLTALNELFSGISLFDGKNPASQVTMEARQGYADGKATTINLPVAAWMHMVATHRSQQASHKGQSSVAAVLSTTGALIPTKTNAEGKQVAYGYDYKDPLTQKTTTYLVDSQTLDDVETMLNANHKAAFDAAKQFFQFQPALDYLKGLYRSVNGEELVLYKDYFPTVAVGQQSDVLTQMPRLLKNAKILQERQGLPMRVRGGDMLSELQGYARREEHYVGNVATLVNLQRWQQRHDAVLTQQAPEWVKDYLEELEIDLNDPTARSRQQGDWTEVKVGGVDVGLRAMLRRFTTSVFSFSPALPLKQVMTMMQGVGLGIVENKYLSQATLSDLAPLFIEAYHLARQNDDKALYGTSLKETAYLQEMAQNRYLATVINRAVGRSEAFIGRPSMDDIKANPASGTVAGVRAALHTVADYGLGAVRRSDRAVLLSFWRASQYQVQADIAAGKMVDANGNPVTDMNSDEAMKRVADLTERLVYDTNQMTSESDRTPLQRDRSLASTLIGLYSGQQQRLLNSFMQRYADWVHAAPGTPEKETAFGQMAWVGFNNIVLNAALMAVISMMWRLATKMITGDDREEDYAQTLAWDTARGVLGSFPSLPTEGIVMLTTMTDNQKWSSGLIEYAPGEAVGQVINGLQQSVRYMSEEDEVKKTKLLNQLVYNLADGGTKLTGVSNNLGRILGKMAKSKPKKVSEEQWEELLIEE
jgi:hypothetical protein